MPYTDRAERAMHQLFPDQLPAIEQLLDVASSPVFDRFQLADLFRLDRQPNQHLTRIMAALADGLAADISQFQGNYLDLLDKLQSLAEQFDLLQTSIGVMQEYTGYTIADLHTLEQLAVKIDPQQPSLTRAKRRQQQGPTAPALSAGVDKPQT